KQLNPPPRVHVRLPLAPVSRSTSLAVVSTRLQGIDVDPFGVERGHSCASPFGWVRRTWAHPQDLTRIGTNGLPYETSHHRHGRPRRSREDGAHPRPYGGGDRSSQRGAGARDVD